VRHVPCRDLPTLPPALARPRPIDDDAAESSRRKCL
jgi:hypothetical protein